MNQYFPIKKKQVASFFFFQRYNFQRAPVSFKITKWLTDHASRHYQASPTVILWLHFNLKYVHRCLSKGGVGENLPAGLVFPRYLSRHYSPLPSGLPYNKKAPLTLQEGRKEQMNIKTISQGKCLRNMKGKDSGIVCSTFSSITTLLCSSFKH